MSNDIYVIAIYTNGYFDYYITRLGFGETSNINFAKQFTLENAEKFADTLMLDNSKQSYQFDLFM